MTPVPVPLPAVVLFVAHVVPMTEFYRQLAGMHLVQAEADHALLEIAGLQLVIHAMRGEPEPTREPGQMPEPREDSAWKLCLPVDSIAKARERAAALGGQIAGPQREWAAPGYRACDGQDPEGNVIQVREAAP